MSITAKTASNKNRRYEYGTGSFVKRDFYNRYNDTYLMLLESQDAAIWNYHINIDRIDANTKWYDLIELRKSAPSIHCMADFRNIVHPADRDWVAPSGDPRSHFKTVRVGDRYQYEFRIIIPNKPFRWMRVVARAVADKPNGGALIVGRFEDITLYRKYLEANGSNSGHYLDVNDPLCPNGYLITSREVECLIWVSLGKTAWETANIMGRSARTVEFHLNNAVKKLGASNKVHAAAKAIRLGLL